LLLLPPLRDVLFTAIARRVRTHVQVDIRAGRGGRPRGVIIEGEFEEVEPGKGEGSDGETPPRRLPPENGGPP
jgi:hypothetical protein